MCPLYPVHILILYAVGLGSLWFVSFGAIGTSADAVSLAKLKYDPDPVKQLLVGKTRVVKVRARLRIDNDPQHNLYLFLDFRQHLIRRY